MASGERRHPLVIFAGDLIATDQDALNTWLSTGRKTKAPTLPTDELHRIICRFRNGY